MTTPYRLVSNYKSVLITNGSKSSKRSLCKKIEYLDLSFLSLIIVGISRR
jgi:hypothetical protein